MRPYFLGLRTRTVRLVALGATVLALTASARAEDDEQARIRYERAVKLYEEGVYDAALVELRRAYDLRPSYKLFYNMALSRYGMRDYAGALDDYRRYLKEGGERVASERRSAVEAEIQRLEQRVARLSIKTDVSGAEVLVDDVLVGSTPLAGPIAVNSGVRRVVVRHPEHPAQTLRVSIAGGELQELSLPLGSGGAPSAQPLPAPVRDDSPGSRPDALRTDAASSPPAPSAAAPAPVSSPSDFAPPSRRRLIRGLAWGGTAAAAASAIALGITAMVHDGSIADARPRPIADPGAYDDKATRTERMALASDVLTGVTLVGAGVSIWLTLRTRERPLGSVALGVRPSGLSLRGAF